MQLQPTWRFDTALLLEWLCVADAPGDRSRAALPPWFWLGNLEADQGDRGKPRCSPRLPKGKSSEAESEMLRFVDVEDVSNSERLTIHWWISVWKAS